MKYVYNPHLKDFDVEDEKKWWQELKERSPYAYNHIVTLSRAFRYAFEAEKDYIRIEGGLAFARTFATAFGVRENLLVGEGEIGSEDEKYSLTELGEKILRSELAPEDYIPEPEEEEEE